MQIRNLAQEYNAPYPSAGNLAVRYLDGFMRLTHDYPDTLKKTVYAVGFGGLAVAASPLLSSSVNTSAAVSIGLLSVSFASLHWIIQNKAFGFPFESNIEIYNDIEMTYRSAKGHLITSPGKMPTLKVRGDSHYDAGFVEGFLLGRQLKVNLESTAFLYPIIRMIYGPKTKSVDLNKSLAAIKKSIPQSYQDEMQGKVDGYNTWLSKQKIHVEKLEFNRYLFLQLLPDMMNYSIFSPNSDPVKILNGCTAIAVRVGNYSVFTRVLDWPSYGVAGKYFIQMDRQIADTKRTIDVGQPLVSGALTSLNENALLVEINVSESDKVLRADNMPAIFFNRYCAEQAKSVKEIADISKQKKPLGAYHLTATDGAQTHSFHYYQSMEKQGEHAIEILNNDPESPQLMVVANHGVRYKNGKPEVTNHCDSNERKANVHGFFNQPKVKQAFNNFIKAQKNSQQLLESEINDLKQLCLQMARVALVCNKESVFCGIYVYFENKLIDASVATNNNFAQDRPLEDFKGLTIPSRSNR